MSKQTITESEYEIMKILWEKTSPIGLGEIIKELPEGKWARNTVSTLLARLCEKGIAGYNKKGNINMYFAAVNRDEYRKNETKSFLSKLYGGSVKNLVAAFYEENEISDDDLKSLRKMLSK